MEWDKGTHVLARLDVFAISIALVGDGVDPLDWSISLTVGRCASRPRSLPACDMLLDGQLVLNVERDPGIVGYDIHHDARLSVAIQGHTGRVPKNLLTLGHPARSMHGKRQSEPPSGLCIPVRSGAAPGVSPPVARFLLPTALILGKLGAATLSSFPD